ncbi:hypothetical protein G6F62_011909 [Rhizopus arrhizus]|nr:hypothetical protein G6F62_011909 [Rhizopus arrhizus]
MALQSYHFTIVPKKGTLNQDADALSRLAQNSQVSDQLTLEMFKQLQIQDPEIKIILREGVSYPNTWINGVLARKVGDTNVPRIPRSLTSMILRQAHDGHLGGHFGVAKTMNKHCEACQRRKVRTESTAAPLKSILPSYLGEIWASDVAVLTESKQGNKYLLVFMEYLSKWVVTAALPSFDTDHVVPILLFEVVLKLGVPARLITDNGSNYVSEAMVQVCRRLGIQRSLISDQHLPFVTFAYNTATQASTGFSPFEVLYGRKAKIPTIPDIELEQRKPYRLRFADETFARKLDKIIGVT